MCLREITHRPISMDGLIKICFLKYFSCLKQTIKMFHLFRIKLGADVCREGWVGLRKYEVVHVMEKRIVEMSR